MIPAKGYAAVFRRNAERGEYVQVDVVAWSEERGALCADRSGVLVAAKDHAMFVTLVTEPPGDTMGAQAAEKWFRRCLGLREGDPLKQWESRGSFTYAVHRPFVPSEGEEQAATA
jgi:hypothetical protein